VNVIDEVSLWQRWVERWLRDAHSGVPEQSPSGPTGRRESPGEDVVGSGSCCETGDADRIVWVHVDGASDQRTRRAQHIQSTIVSASDEVARSSHHVAIPRSTGDWSRLRPCVPIVAVRNADQSIDANGHPYGWQKRNAAEVGSLTWAGDCFGRETVHFGPGIGGLELDCQSSLGARGDSQIVVEVNVKHSLTAR
jgi:hypothetical protein